MSVMITPPSLAMIGDIFSVEDNAEVGKIQHARLYTQRGEITVTPVG
nr:hypothetical protein [uncultured Halomonas sp.]